MNNTLNTIEQMARYFTSVEKPMTINQFLNYWDSLTESEQDELRAMDLGY